MKKDIVQKPKSEYRYKYIKDFQNTVITISGGIVVASLAFISSIDQRTGLWWAYIGLAALGLSILLHIILLFLSYIASGFMHDYLIAMEWWDEYAPSDSAIHAKADLDRIGKLITPLLLTSLVLTPTGFVAMFVFVVSNI